MIYQARNDLPDTVWHTLPAHAQDIYKSAFNHALHEYGSEETAHQAAWSAVKKKCWKKIKESEKNRVNWII